MGSICCCCPQSEDEEYNQINRNNSTKVYKLNDENRDQNIRPKGFSNENRDLKQKDSNSSGQQLSTDPTQYKSASREEMLAAAERRAAQQSNRGAKGVVKLKSSTADLPENTNSGLKWQVG